MVEILDKAVDEHLSWLSAWSRSLILDRPVPASSPDGIASPDFAAWYARHRNSGLANQPAVHTLARLHDEMCRAAERIATDRQRGKKPHPDDVDGVLTQAETFVAQARRLERAFAMAASELDPLTGLQNRRAMVHELERERARLLRTGTSCCVALADLDHFKSVNDRYGHAVGDDVLVACASRFLAHTRTYDSVFRYGGEEFLFCLVGMEGVRAAAAMERLRRSIAATPIAIGEGPPLQVSVSVGVAAMDTTETVDGVVERADKALYAAKQAGRNRTCLWVPEGAVPIEEPSDPG